MHAAVVTSFDEPPHYREFDVPTPNEEDLVLVDVLAVGLHPACAPVRPASTTPAAAGFR
jgi:NADPH:quinone reductase-like Zn-dependent oxidoreductase